MPIALSDEHEEQQRSARRWLATHCPPATARVLLDAEREELQSVWKELAAEGWLGIHLPESLGGEGFGLLELAVVLEETGWSLTPGPMLATVVTSALLAEARTGAEDTLLAGLIDGSTPAGIAVGGEPLSIVGSGPDGELVVSGTLRPVLGAATAAVVLAPVLTERDEPLWCLFDVISSTGTATVTPLPSLDATRRVGSVELERFALPSDRQLPALTTRRVREVLAVLMCAEHVGGARWCLETATEYAKARVQFGRPIGQFQAVKHRLADMVVRVEQMTAVAWDAATAAGQDDEDGASLAASVAGALCLDGFVRSAQECIQLLGGIGFTWEHDAHLYLKRALADRQLLGDSDAYCRDVAERAVRGVRRELAADLPEEAERIREELAPLMIELTGLDGDDRRRRMVEEGLVAPHWPAPWGRDAGAVEQVVIDEVLGAAAIAKPHLGIGAWALPAIIANGTSAQAERWVRPTLLGELAWCQMFSEPGAGSDLASLTTRAERIDGGWKLTGQKVWTSLAKQADFAICLARTDPAAPKHEGITYFIVDMRSAGIDVRPLRELTGAAMFNEVFLDGVEVPDECVIGEVNGGWTIARMTLANERVSMASGSAFGIGVESLIKQARYQGGRFGRDLEVRLGQLLCEAQSLQLMTHRATLRSLAGTDPGSSSSLRKLLGAEHEQRVQELGLLMLGPEGATLDGRAGRWSQGLLATRCLTIAGGTSEVQRNVIAERILGLPRDAEPGM